MEVKMAATTRILQLILKKLSLGHLTELFRRDNNTTDMICNQQGTGGLDEFAVTIMLHKRRVHRMRAPEFDIPKSILEDLLEEGFTNEEIFCMLSVSRKNNLSQNGKMRT